MWKNELLARSLKSFFKYCSLLGRKDNQLLLHSTWKMIHLSFDHLQICHCLQAISSPVKPQLYYRTTQTSLLAFSNAVTQISSSHRTEDETQHCCLYLNLKMNIFLLYFLAVKVWSFNVESFSRRLEIIDELNYRGWPESVTPSANCWQSNVVIFEFMTFYILRVYFKWVVISSLYLWAQEMFASVDGGFSRIFQVETISKRLR